jgi:hydrogenase-4 component B
MSPGPLLLAAALSLLASLVVSRHRPGLWLTFVLGASAAALAAVIATFLSVASAPWDWPSGIPLCGELLHLRLDAISALFLALLAVVAGAGAVYARGYWPDTAHPRTARAGRKGWSAILLSMGFVLVTGNGLHFLLGWELFTVSAFFLITLDSQRRAVRNAGWLYLAASHAGTVCLFAYFSILAARTGSWELGPLQAAAATHGDLAPLFWLALFGFGLKAGLFPLHIWLPSAHANAPSHVSALLSGVTIKMGIYGLVRFSGWMPVPPAAGWVIAALGVTSAVLGVAFALGQHDLKRLLAYHSVENIGIILIGLGFALVASADGQALWGQLALAGALLHVWNHGLFKSLLFLGAGSVLHATGTREMSQLGGLARIMPWTAALFALGAAAICGLPPLNGFVSEWLVFLGLFEAVLSRAAMTWLAIPAAILLGVTGALALACFVKVCGVVFLGAPRSAAAEHAHECAPAMRGPMILLAACCVVIGLAPIAFWPAISQAVAVWQPAWTPTSASVPLLTLGWAHLGLAALALAAAVWLWRRIGRQGLRRALTWDCGYAFPTARMQYTAGSFAGIITEWFDWILRPQRHEHRPEDVLPARVAFSEHTPETVLEHVIHPAGAIVMKLSDATRRLQHGHLQSYLLYLVLGLGGLAAIVASGSGQ